MIRFLIYAVIAYFLYQFIMAVNWGSAFSSATSSVGNTAGAAGSGIMDAIGNAFNTVKNLVLSILP